MFFRTRGGWMSDFPREGYLAVAGFSKRGRVPMVILIDMEKGWAFYAQKMEPKYEHLFMW